MKMQPQQQKLVAEKFNKYERAILKNIWSLSTYHKKMLNSRITYISTVEDFLSKVEPEEFPYTYEVTFSFDHKRYFVSYAFCSLIYLSNLCATNPKTLIAYQLRVNEDNKFYGCLVRPIDKKMCSEETLLQAGAIKL